MLDYILRDQPRTLVEFRKAVLKSAWAVLEYNFLAFGLGVAVLNLLQLQSDCSVYCYLLIKVYCTVHMYCLIRTMKTV